MAQANLAKVERDIQVGIWSNLKETITVYPDRTVVKSWMVRWINNNGSLKPVNQRITGQQHAALLTAVQNASADNCEPDDYIWEVMERYI